MLMTTLTTYLGRGSLPQLAKEAMHVAVSMTNHCTPPRAATAVKLVYCNSFVASAPTPVRRI
jgi:hypothetical protein